ncbi:MAG: general secretion pathway protein GspB [Steroidobacteraceae bacterium]
MSFILDALRKSEHERQRTTGPALAEVPVAPRKPKANVWAPVAIALLVVNLAVVGVLLLRKAGDAPAAGSPPVAAVTTPAPTPAVARPAPPPVPGGLGAQNPLAAETTGAPGAMDPELVAHASSAPPGPPAVTSASPGRGSVVYETMPESADTGGAATAAPPAANRASPEGPTSLPSAEELVGVGVPPLNLDLHVYSNQPAERLVFINSHKYREGDTLQEGPVIRQITPRGVLLEYSGRTYLLSQQ